MRYFILLLIYTSTVLNCISQSQEVNDSLEKLVSTNIPDSTKMKVLGDLAWNYSFIDPNKAMKFANEELKLSIKANDNTAIGQAYSDLGSIYSRINSNDTAIDYYTQSLKYRRLTGNKEKIAGSLSNLGTVLIRKGDYKNSLKMQLEALKYFDEIGNELYQANTLGNIGALYNDMKNIDKAFEYWNKSLVLAKKVGNNAMIINNMNNIMTWYYKKLDYKNAIKLGEEALEMARASGSKTLIAQVASNLATMYTDNGDLNKAQVLLTEAVQLKQELGDRLGTAITGCMLGRLYIFKKDYKNAEKYLLESVKNAKDEGSLSWLENAYKNLYSVYEGKGDYKKAFETLRIQRDLKDSLIKMESIENINELETQYGTEKKEKENKLLNVQLEKNKLSAQRNNLIYITLLIIISSLVVIIYMRFNRNKLKQELQFQEKLNEQQDKAGRAIIEAEERERRRIAVDLHDGLGQMLSATKMNLSSISDTLDFKTTDDKNIFDKTLTLVDETCKEARNISHSMMPNALLKSGLALAVKEFLDKIDSNKLKIHLTTHGINERLDEKIETVLYRVIQETVNNVIKHSEANQLEIQLIKDNQEISVTIEDNGKGFDTKDLTKFEGIGLKNMMNRVQFLKGNIDFDSTLGKGTFINISIPI